MVFYDDKYTDTPTAFESAEVKDEPYFRKRAKAIYSGWVQGRTGITYEQTKMFSFLRAFGDGRQPVDRYKDYFLNDENSTPPAFNAQGTDNDKGTSKQEQRKGYMNVLWDIISPATKIINTLVGKFEDVKYDIIATPLDSRSKDMIEDEKIKLFVEKENMPFLKSTYQQIGIQYQPPEFIPETQDELELYEQSGGFKPAFARVMEEMVKETMSISDWNEIKKSIVKDFVNIGVTGTRDYYDEVDCKIHTRYVDPEMSTIQFSTFNDHHDSQYFGEFVIESVSHLISIGFDREEVKTFARNFSGYYGNPGLDQWAIYDKELETGGCAYDFYKVCIFDTEWIDTEDKKEVVRKNKYGDEKVSDTSTDRVTSGGKLKKNERLRVVNKRFLYRCKWVVGTDYVYDYGKAFDIIRPTKKDVSLTAHVYKLGTKPITEQLYPVYDNFMILWLKYQNAIATAVNSGYVVYTNYLKNIKAGGGKNPEREALKRFMQSGILLVSETDQRGNVSSRTNRAVEELKGGMGQIFTEIMSAFVFNSRMIEDICGLNPIALGSTPNPNMPVGTTEMSLNAMSSTLKPIMSGMLKIQTDCSTNVCSWIQLSIKTNNDAYLAYVQMFGKFDMEILKSAVDGGAELGIILQPAPTEDEWQLLLKSANDSLMAGRSGVPGISESDFFSIMRIKTSGGSLAMAELLLSDRIRRAKNEAAKTAKESQDNQSKNVMQGEQLKMQMRQQELQLETDLKLKLIEAEHSCRMKEIAAQESLRGIKETNTATIKSDAIKQVAEIKRNSEKSVIPQE